MISPQRYGMKLSHTLTCFHFYYFPRLALFSKNPNDVRMVYDGVEQECRPQSFIMTFGALGLTNSNTADDFANGLFGHNPVASQSNSRCHNA